MQFIKSREDGVRTLGQKLGRALRAGQKVLWLVPGGSNIPISVEVMATLPTSRQNLTVALTDERFGPSGHPDSNWQQLKDSGFQLGSAAGLPVLAAGELSLEDTAQTYENSIQEAFGEADIVIGQFGIGADGHIAGIKPGSPAASSRAWISGYQWDDFTRITLTFDALAEVDAAYAFVFGASKAAALEKLQSQDLPLVTQPAQILKQLKEAYVYNDSVGGKP